MTTDTEKSQAPLGLPRALFWDVNPEKLDLARHEKQIISRVLERGGLVGWQKIRHHYGDDKLRQIVTGLRTLEPRTLNFLCLMLNLKKEDFRCYTSPPFPKAPWIS